MPFNPNCHLISCICVNILKYISVIYLFMFFKANRVSADSAASLLRYRISPASHQVFIPPPIWPVFRSSRFFSRTSIEQVSCYIGSSDDTRRQFAHVAFPQSLTEQHPIYRLRMCNYTLRRAVWSSTPSRCPPYKEVLHNQSAESNIFLTSHHCIHIFIVFL